MDSPVRQQSCDRVVLVQIAELKRGAEIIVCTPGRMIDMLGANSGEFSAPQTFTCLIDL